MEFPLFSELILICALSVGSIWLFTKLHLPPLVGFLLAGIIVGPHGFGWVHSVREVEMLAEIGVVLLLFTIGLEFSLDRLMRIRRAVLVGGSAQMGFTAAAVTVIALWAGLALNQAVFFGLAIALSSTAIVLKVLQEKAWLETPHGQSILGVLIFQDIAVVPVLLMVPLLGGNEPLTAWGLGTLLLKMVAVLGFIFYGVNHALPRLFQAVAKIQNREIFLLFVIVLCFSVAWLTSKAGLSLALGGFLAGLVISRSEFSVQALSSIQPFRDVFTSFFFVSIGMLFNVGLVAGNPLLIVGLGVLAYVLKSALAASAAALLRLPVRNIIFTGLALGQIGEFSFIALQTGADAGLIGDRLYDTTLAFSVVTMALTPFILGAAPRLVAVLDRYRSYTPQANDPNELSYKDHILVVGYGLSGRNMAQAAQMADISYVVLELNPETVREQQALGVPIHFGDASQPNVLEHFGIQRAAVVVVAVNDPLATRHIVHLAKSLNSLVHIIVRTRFIEELPALRRAGADEIVSEQYEASIEMFARILAQYNIPFEDIEQAEAMIRAEDYGMLRGKRGNDAKIPNIRLDIGESGVCTFSVHAADPICGLSLAHAQLRKKYKVTAVALKRDGHLMGNPGANTPLQDGDELYVFGRPQDLLSAYTALFAPDTADEADAPDAFAGPACLKAYGAMKDNGATDEEEGG